MEIIWSKMFFLVCENYLIWRRWIWFVCKASLEYVYVGRNTPMVYIDRVYPWHTNRGRVYIWYNIFYLWINSLQICFSLYKRGLERVLWRRVKALPRSLKYKAPLTVHRSRPLLFVAQGRLGFEPWSGQK